MRKVLSCFLILSLSLPAFGQAGPGIDEEATAEAPVCGEIGQDFEILAREFVSQWSGEPEFCEFKRFTALNEMITKDMVSAPQRYSQRMNYLITLKNKNQEAVNYLLLSFQETWFNTFIDSILMREDGRSGSLGRWLTIGAAGSVVALLALPFTKKYSSKPIRLFQTGLKHFLQKRAITFGSTSVGAQMGRTVTEHDKKAPEVFVSPPLYFGGNDEILDERTYKIFLNEVRNDVISATAGVLGGWALGHGASVVVRDRVLKTWADNAIIGRYGWAASKPVTFASPGMMAGFAVTIITTNAISDFTSDMMFFKKFKEIRARAGGDLTSLANAVGKRQEFQVYSLGEKLRNDLSLQNFILTRELAEALQSESESAAASALNMFKYCVEPRASVLARNKKAFFKAVAKAIKTNSRNVQAALVLAQDAQSVLQSHPHRLTAALASANHKLMMRTTWMLDSSLTAADLWADIESSVKDQPVECTDMTSGMPL